MSAISLKSISGITSITTPAGVDNQLTLHTNDTTQRVKVTQSGIEVVGVATFQDIDVDGHTNLDNVSIAGVSTFTSQIYHTAPGTNTAKITLNNASDTTGMDVGYSEGSGVGFINVGQSGSGLSIKTGGTASGNERLRIDSNGRIGLGINNPGDYFSSYNRVVMGRTNDTGGMTIVSAPTSGGYIAFAKGTSGNQAYRGLISYAHSNDSMRFSTDADSATMVLDNAKRVGIGTDTPRTILHLHDSTNTRIQFTDNGTGAASGDGVIVGLNGDDDFFINNRESGKGIIFFTGSDDERLRITSDGKVGVNQTTWTNKDHMFEVNQSTNDKEIARFTNTGGVSGSVQGKGFIGLSLFNTTTHPHAYVGVEEAGTGNYEGNLTFATRNASNDSAPIERLRIDPNGKVGMGLVSTSASNTCDPDGNQLLIRGASTVATKRGHIMLTGDSATVGQGPQIAFSESGSGDNYAGGYVGFIRIGSNSIGDLVFGTRGTTGDANTVPDERLRITSVGKVGINEDDPYYMLDIKIADSTTALSGGNAGDWGGNGIRLSNTSTTVGSMSLFHFRTNDADWHIGSKFVSSNNSDFVFIHEGTEEALVLSSTGKLSLTSNDGLFIRPATDSNDAKITFSTNNNSANNQIGHIKYNHQDNAIVQEYGEGIIMGGTESNGFVLRVDGGINIKDSGTFGGAAGKITLGTDKDMRIYHTGGDGYIDGTGTGGFRVRWNDQIFSNYNSSGTRRFRIFKDEGLELYAATSGGAGGEGITIKMSDHNGASPTQIGSITYKHSDNAFVNDGTNECFKIHGTENQTALLLDGRMYISDSKFVLKPTFSNFDDIPNGTNSGNSVGCMMKYNNETNGNSGVMSNSAIEPFIANRSGSDGTVIRIRHQGNTEGEIKVNGGTVSYNTFMGAHKAQFADHSKPDLLIGTVLETVDQLATWKYASFSVGVGTDATTKYIPYYGSKNDGETDTITFESNTYNAAIKNYRDPMPEITKHVCVKVSDTVGSKAVFGVFNCWEEEDVVERESGNAEYSWNDLDVAALGDYFIRMQSGQTPEVGDYVESAGDGTAKVQSDDIFRSKTIAKITSTTKQKTYSDGSFLVTCTLHCG